MDDRQGAKRRIEDAMADLEAAFGEAKEVYRRLEKAHERGERAPALLADFVEKSLRVHRVGAAAHAAYEEYRRIRDVGQTESPDGE